MTAPYEGGCVCGAVRYRLEAEPLTLYACHCTDCQRHTGSAFGLSMMVPRTALRVIHGAPGSYDVPASHGGRRRGVFCAACATRLWGEPARVPQVSVLRPGTLDDTSWLRPVAHIWVRSAQPWVTIPPDALRFETQPESFVALIDAWRRQKEES